MSIVPARFLAWAGSLEEACHRCGASEEVTSFKVLESRHSGGAIALHDPQDELSCFLVQGYSDGVVGVFYGYVSMKADTEEEALDQLRPLIPADEPLYSFDMFPNALGARA